MPSEDIELRADEGREDRRKKERDHDRSNDKDRSEKRHRDGDRTKKRERSRSRERSRERRHRRDKSRSRSRDRHRDRDSKRRERDGGRSSRREGHSHRSRDKEDGDSKHSDRREKDPSSRHRKRHRDEDREDSDRRHKSRRSDKEKSGNTVVEGDGPEVDADWKEETTRSATNPVPEDHAAVKTTVQRAAWMEAPLQEDVVYKRDKPSDEKPVVSKPDYQIKLHKNELNVNLREGRDISEYQVDNAVSYTFGDSGSQWRLMKLRRVYQAAKETGKSVEEIAIERFGDLKSFDDVREEEQEMERRELYGADRPDAKDKPTGELYKKRLEEERKNRKTPELPPQATKMDTEMPLSEKKSVDQSTLNRMKAALLKAQLRGDPKAPEMEKEYNEAMEAFSNRTEQDIVVLSAMDSKSIAGVGKRAEAKEITTGKRKGKFENNDEMSLEDMVREERRTKDIRGGEGKSFAERISKDARFTDNLDYMDENADRLAKRTHKKDEAIKASAIEDYRKMQRILDSCPLCQQEETPSLAPIISMATRVFLTLPTEPELTEGGAVIVPIQHRNNTIECDDDEWEEIRNFMKCLIRMYHEQGKDVLFYENASAPHRRKHAAIVAVPLPREVGETAPAYFREAIMSSDEEWSQHKKIIDTLSRARKDGWGKGAFRRSLVKEMPYFHVWFEIDGGMGHIVEDENRWPKGDLFAREVLGGMLDVEPHVIRRQGRWVRGKDRREDGFRKKWDKFDWTTVLLQA